MFYLQLTAAVVGIILGIFNLTKESAPLVMKMQENHRHAEIVRKASEIAGMNIQWQYRGNDGCWRYYSDQIGRYWCRVNIQGIQEYCENPNRIASSLATYR